MDSDAMDPGILKESCGLDGVDRVGVPPDTDLRSYRKWRAGSNDRFSNPFQQRAVAQERGASVSADHLGCGTPKVDVDKVRIHPVDDLPSGLP
jgi:hypothetical protein